MVYNKQQHLDSGRTARRPSTRRNRAAVIATVAALAPAAGLALAAGPADAQTPAITPAMASASAPASPTVYRFGAEASKGLIAGTQRDTPTVVRGIPASAGTVTSVATSNSDGYALTSRGEVYAWGADEYGELGNGTSRTVDNTAVRVQFPTGVKIKSLSDPGPFDAELAISTAGRAYGWGLNGDGDLCNIGLIETRPEALPFSDVTLLSGAKTHTLVDSHGHVYACGSNTAGALGDGSMQSSLTPRRVVGLTSGVPVRTLTASWEGSGALLANGEYFDWGYNPAGQLGDGSTSDSDRPVKVSLPGPVSQVFQGGSLADNGQTIARLSDGAIYVWGANASGQLGNGTTTSSDVPVQLQVPAGVSFTTVSSGGAEMYAIDTQGRLWDWGDNDKGQLGIGSGPAMETRPTDTGFDLSAVSATASDAAGIG